MIIFIDRDLTFNETIQINNFVGQGCKCYQSGDFLDIATKIEINKTFYEQKINYFLQLIIDFPHKNFLNQTFNNIYSYNGIKIFYYHKFRLFHNLKESFVLAEFLKSNFTDKEFIIYSDKKQLTDFFADTFKINIKSTIVKQNKWDKYITILKYGIFIFIRYFFSLFRNYNLKKVKHLVIENTKPIKLLDNNLTKKYNNVVFGYLYNKLNKHNLIFNVIDIPKSHKDLKFTKYYFFEPRKNVKTYYYEKAFINNFSLKKYKNIKTKLNQVNNILTTITNNKNTLPEHKAIIKYLISLNKTTAFYLIRYESVKRFFKKHKFKTFLATDENGALTKGIIDAAKQNGIKTFGMQHAGIGKYTLAYILSKKDNITDVIADYTFVWSSYYKEFLINTGNYPAHKIKIVGQPRSDIINLIKKNIPETDNTVMFASQPMKDLNYKKKAAIDILNLAKQNPDINLIIKLHPFEYDGVEYYNSLANKMGVTNYTISNDDLYLLIAKSKLIITCFSTVGAEAAYFYKPLIIIDYNNEDLLKYIESKIAFGVYNFNDLNKISNNILNNNLKPNKIDLDNFINKFAYKIDGKVSDRILQTIYNENNG